jgi:hypothetical protein
VEEGRNFRPTTKHELLSAKGIEPAMDLQQKTFVPFIETKFLLGYELFWGVHTPVPSYFLLQKEGDSRFAEANARQNVV